MVTNEVTKVTTGLSGNCVSASLPVCQDLTLTLSRLVLPSATAGIYGFSKATIFICLFNSKEIQRRQRYYNVGFTSIRFGFDFWETTCQVRN